MARYLESELASLIDANKRCLRDSVERSAHWRDMADTHEATIERLSVVLGTATREFKTAELAGAAIVKWLKGHSHEAVRL